MFFIWLKEREGPFTGPFLGPGHLCGRAWRDPQCQRQNSKPNQINNKSDRSHQDKLVKKKTPVRQWEVTIVRHLIGMKKNAWMLIWSLSISFSASLCLSLSLWLVGGVCTDTNDLSCSFPASTWSLCVHLPAFCLSLLLLSFVFLLFFSLPFLNSEAEAKLSQPVFP